MNIDKDIEIVRDLGNEYYVVDKNRTKISFKESQAIENVLRRLENVDNLAKNALRKNASLKSELKTYKKIAEKLAEKKVVGCINCTVSCVSDEDIDTYIKNEIDWARKEVENGTN